MKKIRTLLLTALLLGNFFNIYAQNCKASFSADKSPSILDSLTYFTNTSSPDSTFDVSYRWFVDGDLRFSSKDFFIQFSSVGTYNVCLLRADSTNNCRDSFCSKQTVVHQRNCRTEFMIKDTLDSCYALFIPTYKDTQAIDQLIVHFGDGDSSIQKTHGRILHQYPDNGTYNTSITTYAAKGKCKTQSSKLRQVSGCIGARNCNQSLQVTIRTYQPFSARKWDANISVFEKTQDTLLPVKTLACRQCNYTEFKNLCLADYYIQAALDSTDTFYHDFMPTYHGNVLHWDSVPTPVSFVGTYKTRLEEIYLIKANNPGGAGSIAGSVTQGTQKKEGDPLGGIQVMLLNEQNEPVAFTYSRNDGYFSFDDIPIGLFYLYAEVPGVKSVGNWITLAEDESELKDVKIEVDIDLVVTSARPYTLIPSQSFQLYPNPAQNAVNVVVENQVGQLTVTDLSGRKLIQTNIQQKLLLNLEALESGTYIISFATESGVSLRKPLIKQ